MYLPGIYCIIFFRIHHQEPHMGRIEKTVFVSCQHANLLLVHAYLYV